MKQTRLVLGLEVALVAAAVAVGAWLNHRRVPIHADAPPLYAGWLPHVGPGTPVALAVAVLVVHRGPVWATRLPWRRALPVLYLTALAWTLGLALVDGWTRGVATRLTPQAEYLHDVPKVAGIGAMLAGFSGHILDFRPGSWATHVAGHPPGAFLIFVVLDRIGLGGGAWAGMLCVVVGASAPVSVAVALRRLDSEATARRVLPFLALFPGAVWVGASADGIFAAVLAAGLALLASGGWRFALPAGVLLGFALYLSYGLVLAGGLALAVVILRRESRAPVVLAGAAGAGAVVVAFTAAGFWWLTGYRLVVERYYQGWAADRPYWYWVWANLASLVLCAGPVVGPALYRAASGPAPSDVDDTAPRRALALLPFAALAAICVADLTGLSKAEVERIWLPYAIWLLVATAWLPAAHRRWWLAAQALTALAVNHLLLTGW
jgi:methylthioxylose transferase